MYKKSTRFQQSRPYSEDNRHEHKRRYKWTLEDRKIIERMRKAALSNEELICNIKEIVSDTIFDLVNTNSMLGLTNIKYILNYKFPTEGLDNAKCPVNALIGDRPAIVINELAIYLSSCLNYARSISQEIHEISRYLENSKMLTTKVDSIVKNVERICRDVGVRST